MLARLVAYSAKVVVIAATRLPGVGWRTTSLLLDLDRVLNPQTHAQSHDYASSRGAGGFGTSSGPTRRYASRRAGRQTTRHSHDARVTRRLDCGGRHARRIALGRRPATHRRQSPADPHLRAASR